MQGTLKSDADSRERKENLGNSVTFLQFYESTSECFFVHLILVKFV